MKVPGAIDGEVHNCRNITVYKKRALAVYSAESINRKNKKKCKNKLVRARVCAEVSKFVRCKTEGFRVLDAVTTREGKITKKITTLTVEEYRRQMYCGLHCVLTSRRSFLGIFCCVTIVCCTAMASGLFGSDVIIVVGPISGPAAPKYGA